MAQTFLSEKVVVESDSAQLVGTEDVFAAVSVLDPRFSQGTPASLAGLEDEGVLCFYVSVVVVLKTADKTLVAANCSSFKSGDCYQQITSQKMIFSNENLERSELNRK